MGRLSPVFYRHVGLLMCLGLAAFRIWQVYPSLDEELNGDARWTYIPAALALLEDGVGFLTRNPRSLDVAPLAYIWPALWGADRVLIQLANTALFMVSLALLWGFACRLGGILAGLIALPLLIGNPVVVWYAPQVLTESPFLFGLALAMYAGLRACTDSRRRFMWLALFVVGLDITLLIRPVLQYLVVLGIGLLALCVWQARLKLGMLYPLRGILRSFLLALILATVLPLAFVVKNGLCFGAWAIASGSGTGIYYGVSPFKNGSDPAYSNFFFDGEVVPRAIAPDTGGHPLDWRGDAANRLVALELVKNTTLADNVRFFWTKWKGWMLVPAPEVWSSTKPRKLRNFQWLSIGLFMALCWLGWRKGVLQLPGDEDKRVQIAAFFLLLILIFLMALQLTPFLYNSRYAGYFIEPWLAVLTGVSVSCVVFGNFGLRWLNARYGLWVRLGILLVLVMAANALARDARRNEVWRLDAYRPGPTKLLLGAERFSAPAGEGLTALPNGSWEVTDNPATLRIGVDASAMPQPDGRWRDAMWRMRFALSLPPHAAWDAKCAKVAVQVMPHQEAIHGYEGPMYIQVERSGKAATYMLGANGHMRPANGAAQIILTLHCPLGAQLRWHGMEMRRSAMADAAKDLVENGIPINPYLHSDP